jgi:hypothetical protein
MESLKRVIREVLAISDNNEKSAPEKAEAAKPQRPVFFKVPENWEDLPEDEQDKILDRFIEAIRRG